MQDYFKDLYNIIHNDLNTKMKEPKYYTPEIEDIHIGYECEIESNGKWTLETIKGYNDNTVEVENCSYFLNGNNLRTSYLTKEQIEKEGCEFIKESFYWNAPIVPTGLIFKKNNHWITYQIDKEILSIIPIDPVKAEPYFEQMRFIGKTKCINEFRKIIKLLEI